MIVHNTRGEQENNSSGRDGTFSGADLVGLPCYECRPYFFPVVVPLSITTPPNSLRGATEHGQTKDAALALGIKPHLRKPRG